MIIQNTNANQGGLPSSHISADAPRAVAKPPKAEHASDVSLGAPQQPSPELLKSAIDVINRVMQQSNNSLEFSVDNDTKKSVVKLVDTETGELIRQYPSDEMLAISRSIDQYQQRQGLLLKHEA